MFEMTNEAIGAVYGALKAAVVAAYEAGEAAIAAKNGLEVRRAALLLAGEITGKNEVEREAQARRLLAGEFKAAEIYEAEARRSKVALEVARLDVEQARAQLRLMELVEAAAG